MHKFFFLPVVLSLLGCAEKNSQMISSSSHSYNKEADTMIVANLDEDAFQLNQIRIAFEKNNPGYVLTWYLQVNHVEPSSAQRVLFVQKGGGTAVLNNTEHSKVAVGDIILLKPNTTMMIDSLVDLVAFTTPESPSDSIPSFIRPDWDLNITDVAGGCATETNAYRRILLTWQGKVGKYLFKSLNAHRVRITDSFTHYHPLEGGFDEFYLVQMVQPGAAIITSSHYDLIENPDHITPTQTKNLFKRTTLKVGDLVYLPRGMVHRGVDGVLAQVITVPGFIPGAEIGVDHHLKSINDRLNLTGNDALPYHKSEADTVMIK